MRKLYLLQFLFLWGLGASAQIIDFPDLVFKTKLLAAAPENNIAKNLANQSVKIDTNSDGEIDAEEAAAISFLNFPSSGVASIEGIHYFVNLKSINCTNNNIVNIDISPLPLLTTLQADFNANLAYLNIKNGVIRCNVPPPPPAPPGIGGAMFEACPNLTYLCVGDDVELNDNAAAYLHYYYPTSSISLNSYCSFNPGGVFYTLQGNAKFDLNANGCDAGDANYPNLKLAINNGTTSFYYIDYSGGNYSIALPAGNYTVTPILNNPSYFQVNPSAFSVGFPTDSSPHIQNFCIEPIGSHSDLEVEIIPIGIARPGFDSHYEIRIKNNGNQIESGAVNLTFNDAVLDYVTATPAIDSQALNMLTWNFTNFSPFETRTIEVTLNLNSPMETPPVNSGFILNYSVAVNSANTDETPSDNTALLHQNVVNSLDPNDKTCLEGTTITPEMVGKDVHYMIRFENTGTANAENIVVKDMIDTTKFDIASLVPTNGSHPFVTKISNTNKVEFIFENINLPFDDANNDGYVAFKIKTKPTLVLGNSFSNSASIYFDYNFPILTNNATTTIAVLASPDFAFENYIAVYPNPANNVLNIDLKQQITISSVSIYNVLGQIIETIPNAQQIKSIDISNLKTGNYFLKVNSDKGNSSIKFIKQ